MAQQARHILQLQLDSSIVDGFVSVTFDLLLLSVCHILSQSICSSYNLYHVYDIRQPLLLHSTRTLFSGHGPVGHVRVSRILSFILSFCSICVILLGFSINGRLENTFRSTSYKSVVSIDSPPLPIKLDYLNEYNALQEQKGQRPDRISRRLIALSVLDRCQVCSYSHCEYHGLGFKNVELNGDLVESWNLIDNWTRNGVVECVTSNNFKNGIVSWRYKREKTHADLKCDLESITVSGTNLFTSGKPTGNCDVTIEDMRCFSRPEQGGPDVKTHCAGVGKTKTSKREHLVLFRNSDLPYHPEITPFAMSLHDKILPEEVQTYLENVAFMASLDLGPAYKLDLMAFATISYDTMLGSRNKDLVNISEINLFIAVPSLVILVLSAVFLITTAISAWIVNVYVKQRQSYNTFSTVPEVLELLVHEKDKTDATIIDGSSFPSIGILKRSFKIGVRKSVDSFLSKSEKCNDDMYNNDWNEEIVM